MWLRILPVIMVFSGFCNGNKDFSCNFQNKMWCGWHTSSTGKCDWKISEKNFRGDSGYIFLEANSNCHSRIQYSFAMWDDANHNYLNFEYYVTGPGPFTLSVSNDVEDYKVNWGCRIQPGGQRREAHMNVTGIAAYIYINGNVRPGSCIIITRIWNANKGKKIQKECPLPTTTPSPTTRLATSTIMPTTFKTPNKPIPSISTSSYRPRIVSSKTEISTKYNISSADMHFTSTPLVISTIRTTESTSRETPSGESLTRKPNPTFSGIDDRTKPSSELISKKTWTIRTTEIVPRETPSGKSLTQKTNPTFSVIDDRTKPSSELISKKTLTIRTTETVPRETPSGESLTQKPNPTFSVIDDRTKPPSDLISKRTVTNQPKSTSVIKLVTGPSNNISSFDKQTGVNKGKRTIGIVLGAVIGSIVLFVLFVLFALITFFFKRKVNTSYDIERILQEQE